MRRAKGCLKMWLNQEWAHFRSLLKMACVGPDWKKHNQNHKPQTSHLRAAWCSVLFFSSWLTVQYRFQLQRFLLPMLWECWCLTGDPRQSSSPVGSSSRSAQHSRTLGKLLFLRASSRNAEGFPSPGGLSFSLGGWLLTAVPICCPVKINIVDIRSFTQAGSVSFSPFLTVKELTPTSCHPTSSHQGNTLASSLPGGQNPG